MARILDFTGDKAKERYEVVYDGLLGTMRGYSAPSETRVIGKVLDKLESIGVTTKRGELATFALDGAGGQLIFEEEEHRLVSESLHQVRWNAQGARKATAVVDWFDSAPPKMDDKGVAAP
jgi:hypothetical protein